MRECIEKFTQRTEHREMDCCAVCLLSHGKEGGVYGTDGELLEVRGKLGGGGSLMDLSERTNVSVTDSQVLVIVDSCGKSLCSPMRASHVV